MIYHCDAQRLNDKLRAFSRFGATPGGGITRFSLSEEARAARSEFVRLMTGIGATIETDDMGDLYATLPGSDPDAKRIVMASHCDSVRNGGNYDGILGVIGAMEVLESVKAQGIEHRHPLTAMIWTNEEGALYPPAMMCSGVVCGQFDKHDMLRVKSAEGKTFDQALIESGYIGSEANRLCPERYTAMLELHIEQGPILEAEKKDIGVVRSVLGMVNYRVHTHGQADHAGTTPMRFRKDALYAAAKALLALHKALDKLDRALVYTTGEIICRPNVHTVIPEDVEFSIDARHIDPAVIARVQAAIEGLPREIHGCKLDVKRMWARDTVYFDEKLVNLVQQSADALGYRSMPINSGAGHDAQYAASILPTTMIFVPSDGGRSHCEKEHTSLEACACGVNVLLNAALAADGAF